MMNLGFCRRMREDCDERRLRESEFFEERDILRSQVFRRRGVRGRRMSSLFLTQQIPKGRGRRKMGINFTFSIYTQHENCI